MAIGAREINRVIRRDFVEILSARKLRRLPESFDPAAARDPFTAFGLYDALSHFGDKIFERVRAFEIQTHLAFADSEDVAMRIGQAGHDRLAMKIDNLCGVKFLRVVV